MQAIKARITKGLNQGSIVETCDNSGAKVVKIVSIKHCKTAKGQKPLLQLLFHLKATKLI